ncbi:helix-turn-helix domain-containing protein [Streptomyces sp. NBC_01754]|uniref:helix-turn-helix transcriptional regulator n=1 Tax=Streptomyces sp. NBC_01754 TaxID=2975930 RepID=UPI002DDA8580|nr:helix-turn-helix domain-containing protein [Streptomyces sp. NBC_01754]WSC95262.1 helix-turn-helix domain-containing protein [Streptomyces sp. NBC_01754]
MHRDPQDWARLGHALRTARVCRGLTQADLGELAGVSGRSVQDAEGGAVPKKRMPYTIGRIAAALGWPEGAVDAILDGKAPPGDAWQDTSVQQQVDAEVASGIITNAMVRATSSTTSDEIKEATRLALDEFRRLGLISETDGVQPSTNQANT